MSAPARPYVDPTTAGAPARGAAAEPAPAWQQASTARRPRQAAPRPLPLPERQRRPGYIASHWHGEQSLVRSYWVNNVLLATPLVLGLSALMSWISVKGDSLQLSAIVLLVGLLPLLAINVWSLVGAWRATGPYLQDGGSRLWGGLARLSLALGALQLLASLVLGLLPSLGEYWQMARGIDPLGQARFSVSADGRSLRLDGVIGMGDGERLRKLLAGEAGRGLKRVELASPGGRLREAERMASALKAGGHGARAVGICASACTLVFLAGQPRHLAPEGQLGFHRASSGTYNPVFEELANQQLAQSYRELGLPGAMIDKTLATPASGMWFVPREELQAQALIAPSPRTLAVPLPAPGAALADYEDALRLHPVWAALEQRSLGTLPGVARAMQAARAAGADDEAVQAAALPLLARQMPALVSGSDAVLRRRYVQLVAAQLEALGEPGACRALLAGRLDVRARLPLELQAAEAQWLLDAARGAPPRWLPRPPSAIEVEVLNRSVGRGALGALAQLWADAPASTAGPACEPVIALLTRLPAQPPARRELAERLLFQARR